MPTNSRDLAMGDEVYSVLNEFILCYLGPTVKATNGTQSFAADVSDPLTTKYLRHEMEQTEFSTNVGEKLQVVFWQMKSKLKINRAQLQLTPIEPVIPLSDFTSRMCDDLVQARLRNTGLEERIMRLNTLLDEMTEAKAQNQRELLERVHAVINSRVKKEQD